MEALYDLYSPCWYGVHNTFVEEEIAAIGPASHDPHDDFDLEAALDVIL